jgi:hypothetical protein
MLTPSAFHTSTPFRPAAVPLLSTGPKSCSEGVGSQGIEPPALVPSTTTLLRFMPRRCRPGVVM